MKRTFRFISAALAACLALAAGGCGNGCGKKNNAKTIVIDGGGDIGNFNSTLSMTQSDVNPFPYNTLEKLCEEWEAAHPDYTVIVNRNSYGGATNSLRPLLNGGTAPDIIYMNGSTVEEDKNNGWFVPMNKYLFSKNPYAPEYEKWIDLYDLHEYAACSDGERYYINLERIPIGIIYNEKLLKDAGYTDAQGNIKSLVTYTDFKAAQKCVDDYGKAHPDLGIKTFLTPYRWYDIYLESGMFSYLIDTCDLNDDGHINNEEFCYAYKTGKWGIDTPAFRTYLQVLKDRVGYFPTGYDQYNPLTEFVNGKCAFIEGVGSTLRQISVNKAINFDYAITGYPTLSEADLTAAGFSMEGIDHLGNGRRGSAGYGTSWWITNSAMNKGDDVVDACADLLMFLTAPKQNNKLIGDLGGGIPLNPDSTDDVPAYLRPILSMYLEDVAAGDKLAWGVVNSWNQFGGDYSAYFLNSTFSYFDSNDLEGLVKKLNTNVKALVDQYIAENEYDTSKW